MKNLHLLPTEKPSRLVKIYNDINRENFTLKLDVEVNDSFKEYVNVYVTSDEEIKDGDWIYCKHLNCILQFKNPSNRHFYKKIILTTDKDLIKDGIQEIPDEFLEWFVKNPSCEFINVDEKTPDEIEVELNIHGHDIGLTDREFDEWLNNGGQLYKIIIPKERQKQHIIDMMNADEEIGLYEELKQETLEEAAERLYPTTINSFTDSGFDTSETERLIFKNGAKWQQEQNKKLYSEEDLLNFGAFVRIEDKKGKRLFLIQDYYKKWFEQFKKK